MSVYTYSLSNDTASGLLGDSLGQAIHDSSIIYALRSISNSMDDIVITFSSALSTEDKATLDGIVASHDGSNLDNPSLVEFKPILPEGGKRKTDRGFKFVVSAGTTHTHDYLVTNDLQIKGGVMYTDKQHINDQISLEIVDTNYTYAGEWYPAEYAPGIPWSVAAPNGVPLHMYVGSFPVAIDGISRFDNDAITTTPLNGLTIRTTYKSHGADDVQCNVGIVAYT